MTPQEKEVRGDEGDFQRGERTHLRPRKTRKTKAVFMIHCKRSNSRRNHAVKMEFIQHRATNTFKTGRTTIPHLTDRRRHVSP